MALLISFLFCPKACMDGGEGRSRVIKFLYAPERSEQGDYVPLSTCPLPPTVSPWNLPRVLFTSLVYLWLIYVYAHVGMLVYTRNMLVCIHRPLQGGLLYIKPPMHLWFICPVRRCRQHPLLGQVGGGWALEISSFGPQMAARIKSITQRAV